MSDDLRRHDEFRTDDGSTGDGFYFFVGALVVAVTLIFVVLSGHHSLFGGGRDQMQVETPHAALDLPQPPVLRVKYQSTICSPVQNTVASCRTA
jgi:hypothetical protein